MKILHFLSVISVAFAFAESRPLDPRFRTFDSFTLNGANFPFRSGSTGIPANADYIVVGTLDGNPHSPYHDMDEADLLKRWLFLRKNKRPEHTFMDVSHWNDAMGQNAYVRGMEELGVQPGQFYQKDVLLGIIEREREVIDEYVAAALAANPDRLELVFEIGNEPNAFPAMAPDTYAWYFMRWRKAILDEMKVINMARKAANQAELQAKFMPAGLWIFEGSPEYLTRVLDRGVDASILGVTFKTRIYADTWKYYQDFLNALKTPFRAFCNRTNEYLWQKNGASVNRECGDYDLDNVSIRWKYRTITNEVSESEICCGNEYFAEISGWDVLKTPADIIDIGNLHFYPYLGRNAAMTLPSQLAFLKDLTALASENSRSKEVWYTEMGNFNPFNDVKATNSVSMPVLSYLRANNIPQATRWYWYQARGEDHKWENIPDNITPTEMAFKMGGSYLLIQSLNQVPGISLQTGLTPSDIGPMSALYGDYQAQKPFQGLLSEDATQIRQLGKAYYNLAVTGPNQRASAPQNLRVEIRNWKPGNVSLAPWQTEGILHWDMNPDPDDDFTYADVWYGVNSPPSASTEPANFDLKGSCMNGTAPGYQLHCQVYLPGFAFGNGYAQVRITDYKDPVVSDPLPIANPRPPEPPDTYCPDETHPLGITASTGVAAGDVLKLVDATSVPLTFVNHPRDNDASYYYTRVSAPGFELSGGRSFIVNSSDLQSHPRLVKSYTDGLCIAATCSGSANFIVTDIPAGLTRDNFVMAHPTDMGFLYFTVQNSAGSRTEAPGLYGSSSLPESKTVWLKDVLRYPDDRITQVKWAPNARMYCPSNPVEPRYFRSLVFSRINPDWPEFTGFESTPFSHIQDGVSLPLFKFPAGLPLQVNASIKPALRSYTVSVDAGSAAKGIGFNKSVGYLAWTPESGHVGIHVVQLTLSPDNPNSIPRKVAIQIVRPEIQATDLAAYVHGQQVEVTGSDFSTATSSPVLIVDGIGTPGVASSASSITSVIPAGASVGSVAVKVRLGNVESNVATVTIRPAVTGFGGSLLAAQDRLLAGRTHTLFGSGLGSSSTGIVVRVGGIPATIVSVSGSSLVFKMPSGLSGIQPVVVERNGIVSAPYSIKVMPSISQLLSLLLN